MILDVFRYTCGNCGRVFDEPNLVGGYGRMLARSSGRGSLALVDAINDDVFTEIERIVSEMVDRSQLSARRFGDVVRYAFSASCDPDADGSEFRIGAHPRCPTCGSHRMESWGPSGKLVELDIPLARHDNWSNQDEARKRDLIRNAVGDFLST